jgi:para-nitrobenzyl esterase
MTILVSPLSQGLFRGAVLESVGMILYTQQAADGKTNKTIEDLLIKDGRADKATAEKVREGMLLSEIETYLRDKSAEEILRARRDGTGTGFMDSHEPIQDGYVVPTASWAEAIADGAHARVPVMIGSTRDEWKDFMPVYGVPVKALSGGTVPSGEKTMTWADLFRVIGVGPRLKLTDVLPLQDDRDFYALVANLKSRSLQATGVDDLARRLTTADPRSDVYAYRFDWSGGGDPALADFKTIFGAAHSMDIPFFQGTPQDAWGVSFTPANREGRIALQGVMMDYLASFVKTLDPNSSNSALPTWPRWSQAMGRQAMTFDADLHQARLSIDTKEETEAGISLEVAVARNAYPKASKVFDLFFGVVSPSP